MKTYLRSFVRKNCSLLFYIIIISFACLYFVFCLIYAIAHCSKNTSNDLMNQNSTAYSSLHIDTYTVKNKKQIYFDSLLDRYSYFTIGDYNFIDSYIGSHGIISFDDPIMSINDVDSSVAVSTGLKYSNLGMNVTPIINYANQCRMIGSKCLMHNINLFNRYSDKSIYSKLYPKRYVSQDIITANETSWDKQPTVKSVFVAPSYAVNEVYGYTEGSWGHVSVKDRYDFYKQHLTPLFQQRMKMPYFTYNNGHSLSIYFKPHDKSRYYLGNNLRATDFYNDIKSNVLYSNGNSFFLQYMYQNMNTMQKDFSNYHIIDVYHKGWHLNPIMLNDFVKQPYDFGTVFVYPNDYKSPYLFNYKIKGKRVWNQIEPVSKQMINFVERQNYNLPCNYNDKHYYYRTIEGTIIPDSNIKYVNGNVKPLIMGNIHDNKVMPNSKKDQAYYATKMEYDFAKKYRNNYKDASQYLNYERSDGGLEPLWMIGLVKDKQIGTYHPGEIVRYNDKLSTKPISKYYIVQHGKQYYLPVYNVHGVTCFKATVTFKDKTRYFVRAQDAYMLMGNKIRKAK